MIDNSDNDDIFNSSDNESSSDNNGDDIMSSDSSEEDIQIDDAQEMTKYSSMKAVVNTYSAFMWYKPAKLVGDEIIIEIPTYILPLAQQVVYGFNTNKTLLNFNIILTDYSWTTRPELIKITNPIFGTKFVGSTLITQVVEEFFKPSFKPRSKYRSSSYLLTPPGNFDPKLLKELVSQGFEENIAENALALFRNDIKKARDFLRTGGEVQVENKINVSYEECPLLYFILEVIEAIIDLQDHCCICRKELSIFGIKPSVCDNELCQFQLTDIGIGNSVYQEIKRDYLAADLLVSMFACAINTNFLSPVPKAFSNHEMYIIISTLPSMLHIKNSFHNDKEMIDNLGEKTVQLLRWIILSNKSHILSLTDDLILPQFGTDCKMFMTLMSTPSREEEFRERQRKYGSLYLWHGSAADRWNSIVRNGLVNASGTNLEVHGACFGKGIYLAKNSRTSRGYSDIKKNPYINTSLGKEFDCIGLCQIANVPQLKDNGWNHVLSDEKACVVRFLVVNLKKEIDVINNPLVNVPTLRDVLEHHANKA